MKPKFYKHISTKTIILSRFLLIPRKPYFLQKNKLHWIDNFLSLVSIFKTLHCFRVLIWLKWCLERLVCFFHLSRNIKMQKYSCLCFCVCTLCVWVGRAYSISCPSKTKDCIYLLHSSFGLIAWSWKGCNFAGAKEQVYLCLEWIDLFIPCT